MSQQHLMEAKPCERLEKGTGRQEQDKVKPWEEEEKLDQEGEEHHQRNGDGSNRDSAERNKTERLQMFANFKQMFEICQHFSDINNR